MKRRDDLPLQHVGLATVCAEIYWEVTGKIPDPQRATEMHRVLDILAHALSQIVPIYAGAASGLPYAINPVDLVRGSFSRGAQVFAGEDGKEVRAMTVERRDVAKAIPILKLANIPFDKAATR
jgi:hypothetical protein